MRFFEVLAHEGEEVLEKTVPALDQIIRTDSINFTLWALLILGILTVISVLLGQKSEKIKYFLFGAFLVVALANTIYLSGSTIYLNQKSKTGGPIHWHADFEIWNCGEEINIKDPQGFSNKTGEEVVHEHNDNRMHFEGVLLDLHDASLSHFFESLGGSMSNTHLTVPTNNGLLTLKDGDLCKGQRAKFQVFVYRTKGDTFFQQKLTDNPKDYLISPQSNIPPGDCVIVELDQPKGRTDKLCNFYKVAVNKGELKEELP